MLNNLRRTASICISTATLLFFTTNWAVAQNTQTFEPSSPIEQLDVATAEATCLQEEIDSIQAEQTAMKTRLEVMDQRISDQSVELKNAKDELHRTRLIYSERIVEIYKDGSTTPLELLLNATTFEDLVARGSLLERIAAQDKTIWKDATIAAADARFQATILEDMRLQDAELARLNDERRRDLDIALIRQQELIEQLSEEARSYLRELQARQTRSRIEWAMSSKPLDQPITQIPAVVNPHEGITFLVTEGQPLEYRSTGEIFSPTCSWYGNEFHGRTTASGQTFNENDFTCASRILPFGTRIALTRGERRIVVVVTDRGPFVAGRDLDLSKAAAQALGFNGVVTVQAEYVVPAD